jgi:MFS family permease
MSASAEAQPARAGIGRGAATTTADKRNAFTAAFLGWLLDGFETYTVVLVGPQVVADLVGPDASPVYFGTILGTTLAAWGVGGLLSGILADYVGRRRTLMLAIVWYAVFAGLTALSGSFAVFIIFRFLTGVGMGAEWGPGSALVSEIWSDRTRGRGVALLQCALGVGFLIATGVWQLVNTGPDSWRLMFVLGVAPGLLAFYVRRFTKDSALWVDADERRQKAVERKQAGDSLDESDTSLSTFTFTQVVRDPKYRSQTVKLLALATATLIGWWATSTWIPAYTGELAAKSGDDPESTITRIAVLYNIGAVAGYVMMGVFADFFGRKRTMFAYYLGALAMVVVLFELGDTLGALAVFAVVNGFFTLGQFTWMAMYPGELYPTHLRATATTVIFNATRFIAAAAAILASYLVDLFGSISTAAVVIGMIYLVGIALALSAGRETKGQPLPA